MTPSPHASPSLGAQAMWLLTAKSFSFVLAIALPLVLVRRMSQEEFGLYKQVFLIVGTAVNVLPLGFGMSAFYFLPRERARQGTIVVNILFFHALTGGLIAALLTLWPGLLATVFNSPALADHARSIALVVVLWSMGSFLEIVTLAMQDVRASTGFIVMSQFSKTGLLVVAAVAVGTVHAVIVAAIAQGVVQIGMLLAYLHSRFPGFWRAFDWRLLRAQATYALPLGSSSLLLKLQDDMHQAFVSNAFGPATYAIYAVGVFKLPFIGIMRESVGSVVLPRINQLEARNESRQILGLVAAAARRLALVYYPVYALLMVTGREVITLLFTEQYAASWPIFAIALTIVPFSIIVLDPVTRAHSERYFFLRMRVVLFAGLAAVLWLFAERLGLIGVIAAVVVANLSGWAVSVYRMGRLLGFRGRDVALFADVPRIALAALVASLAAEWVHASMSGSPAWLVLVACGPVFAVVYAAAIVRAHVLRPAEVTALAREALHAILPRRFAAGRERPGPAPATSGESPASQGV